MQKRCLYVALSVVLLTSYGGGVTSPALPPVVFSLPSPTSPAPPSPIATTESCSPTAYKQNSSLFAQSDGIHHDFSLSLYADHIHKGSKVSVLKIDPRQKRDVLFVLDIIKKGTNLS